MYSAWEAVQKFHELNHQLVNLEPAKEVPIETQLLRFRLHAEEFGELSAATHEKDEVKTADGLADLKYVTLGTGVSYGIKLSDRFDLPKQEIGRMNTAERFYHLRAIQTHLNTLTWAMTDHNIERIWESLEDAGNAIAEFSCLLGYPLQACFWEVHRANMSKKLGGATDGKKYGEGGGKAGSYLPPQIEEILKRCPGWSSQAKAVGV
jgi:predicted HAD superfamily Cof-like phosphohydrolase